MRGPGDGRRLRHDAQDRHEALDAGLAPEDEVGAHDHGVRRRGAGPARRSARWAGRCGRWPARRCRRRGARRAGRWRCRGRVGWPRVDGRRAGRRHGRHLAEAAGRRACRRSRRAGRRARARRGAMGVGGGHRAGPSWWVRALSIVRSRSQAHVAGGNDPVTFGSRSSIRRPPPSPVRRLQVAAEQRRVLRRDRQAEPAAAAVTRRVGLVEPLEDPLEAVGRHARAPVRRRRSRPRRAGRRARPRRRRRPRARGRCRGGCRGSARAGAGRSRR